MIWTNSDGFPHTVTSISGAFDSGNIDPGKTYSYTFNQAGPLIVTLTVTPPALKFAGKVMLYHDVALNVSFIVILMFTDVLTRLVLSESVAVTLPEVIVEVPAVQ